MKKKLLSCSMFLFFTVHASAGHLTGNLLITAKLEGSQEVPPVTTNAIGVASLLFNPTRDTVCVKVSVTGLSGPVTGIHIHEGGPGVNGGIVISLMPFLSGNRVEATLTGMDVSDVNISKFLSGKFYLNVHTAANPNGEIRGQLNLETDFSFPVILDGNQEVPPVSTSAYGVGFFNLSRDLSEIIFNVITQGLSGAITGAHLHYGSAGTAGNIITDLSGNVNGNILSGTISAPSQALLDSLMASKIYVNVHTAANPNGEIRSALFFNNNYLHFDASLDGSQEVPAVATSSKGSATIQLNTTFDTLWYDLAAEGLSGPITGAHFHNEAAGNNGGVIIDLTSGIMGNRVTGKITGTGLADTLINKFLEGEIYLNLHTSAYPNGEIRGQVYRTAREGFTFSMDGSQEIPPVVTSATGSGIVSIDRDQENAHFMFAASGLTATGAHFHHGMTGQTGNIIFDLTPFYLNNSASGYWKSSDTTPFTMNNATQFAKDSIYVNIHTSAYPNGEIRGQAQGGFACSGILADLNEKELFSDAVGLYPNPSSEFITLDLNSLPDMPAGIIIQDILGREVYSCKVELISGHNNKQLDIKKLQKGMYYIKILAGKDQYICKFIRN